MSFLYSLSEIRTPILDVIIQFITEFGGQTIAVLILCFLYWCVNKNTSYRVAVAFFFSALLVQGLKIQFRVDRPWVIDPSFKPVESALEGATGYSFPSGHTQNATALYGTLGLAAKKWPLRAICFFAILLVVFSRMYLGVHTPSDVLVSFLITSVVVVVSYILFHPESIQTKGLIILCVVMFIFSIALFIFAYTLYQNEIIESNYVSDCCKASGAGIGFAIGLLIEKKYINFSEKTNHPLHQLLKFVIGIAIVLVIKSGLKLIIGSSLLADAFRYLLLILWIIALWPLCIKKWWNKKTE